MFNQDTTVVGKKKKEQKVEEKEEKPVEEAPSVQEEKVTFHFSLMSIP